MENNDELIPEINIDGFLKDLSESDIGSESSDINDNNPNKDNESLEKDSSDVERKKDVVKKQFPDNDLENNKNKFSKRKKKKKLYKILYIIAMTVLISIFVGCSVYLIVYFWQAKKIDKQVDELKQMIIEEDSSEYEVIEEETIVSDSGVKTEFVYVNGTKVQKKFAGIYEKNNDFVGWLKISDTEIDYPVMQTLDDEEYYLHRDFDKNYNGNGTLFIDTDANVNIPSDNLLIYGHNMKNGKMFHDILKYEDEEFYNSHKYIEFDTINGDGKYEVIAAFRTEIYDKNYTGFKYYTFFDASTSVEFDEYVNECKQRTPYTIDATAAYGDKLITLSTCAYHSDEGRFVVVAKKVE